MAEKMAERIAEILKEPNFQTAEKALTDFCGTMDGEFRNLLVDIIVERWIDTPKDVPFSYARSIWNRKDINREEYQALLEEIRSYPIAPINKAKISDFLWVVENDFSNAKIAETAYCEHLKNTGAFADHIMAINRILFISKKIRSKEINEEVRKNLLIKVLEEYDNSSHAKIGYLIKTAMEEKVDTGYLIPYVENILKTYDDNSCDAPLIGKFCDLLEELYCRKNNWQKKKCITEPKLIAIRRRKIQAVRMEAEYAGASSKGNLMRKIHYLKEVIQLLKTIQGTEEERKALLQEIAQIEEASLSEMMVWSDKQDASGIVKELFRQLEDLDKEEALCYFASFIPIPERERVKNQVLNRTGILHTIFPAAILGKGGKLIAKSGPVKKPDGTIDEGALKDNMERTATMEMDYFAQILVRNTFEYIRSRFVIEESDVKKIVDVSCAIPEGRKESYTKGLMFGFSGDFLTALSILIPQIEEASLSERMVWSDKQDASGSVKELFRQLEDLYKEEALCYFASFLPIPVREKVKNQVLNRTGILNTIFPAAILGKGGKLIAKSRPVKKPDGTIDEGALKDNMERTAAMEMDYFAQILVRNTFEYIRSKFLIEESDIKKIVDVSCAIPEGRKESYTKGLMFGFSGDFLTALSILIPQIENAVRYLAVECGEPVYNMNEEGIEEVKPMHAVLELEGVKESLDEDLIFALNTIFCSKFGFNMRNNVAHGMLDDQAFQSFKALYIWWFALKFCYLFCGKLQEENRSKINKKLKQLMEKKDNMDEN